MEKLNKSHFFEVISDYYIVQVWWHMRSLRTLTLASFSNFIFHSNFFHFPFNTKYSIASAHVTNNNGCCYYLYFCWCLSNNIGISTLATLDSYIKFSLDALPCNNIFPWNIHDFRAKSSNHMTEWNAKLSCNPYRTVWQKKNDLNLLSTTEN